MTATVTDSLDDAIAETTDEKLVTGDTVADTVAVTLTDVEAAALVEALATEGDALADAELHAEGTRLAVAGPSVKVTLVENVTVRDTLSDARALTV